MHAGKIPSKIDDLPQGISPKGPGFPVFSVFLRTVVSCIGQSFMRLQALASKDPVVPFYICKEGFQEGVQEYKASLCTPYTK